MKKIVNTSNAPAPIGPYSQAIIAGGMVYVSGQVAINPATGEIVSENIDKETEQVMKNLSAILAEAGTAFDKMVKCSIFVKNMNDFDRINKVYGNFFPENPPARETVEVGNLPKFVNVEISCIATLD